MYPVRFVVSKWQKGSSHRQELLLWRTECLHFFPPAGVFVQTHVAHQQMCKRSILQSCCCCIACSINEVEYCCYVYSCTRGLEFQVLLSLWALRKNGTLTSSPNSFLPVVRAECFSSHFVWNGLGVSKCSEWLSVLCVSALAAPSIGPGEDSLAIVKIRLKTFL